MRGPSPAPSQAAPQPYSGPAQQQRPSGFGGFTGPGRSISGATVQGEASSGSWFGGSSNQPPGQASAYSAPPAFGQPMRQVPTAYPRDFGPRGGAAYSAIPGGPQFDEEDPTQQCMMGCCAACCPCCIGDPFTEARTRHPHPPSGSSAPFPSPDAANTAFDPAGVARQGIQCVVHDICGRHRRDTPPPVWWVARLMGDVCHLRFVNHHGIPR